MPKINYSLYPVTYAIVAVIVFVTLTVISIKLFGQPKSMLRRYPPWIGECPDYWIRVVSPDGTVSCQRDPNNANGLGKCNVTAGNYVSTQSMPSSDLVYGGTSQANTVNFKGVSLAKRCNWAKSCGVFWEGVSDVSCTDTDHFNKYSVDNYGTALNEQ